MTHITDCHSPYKRRGRGSCIHSSIRKNCDNNWFFDRSNTFQHTQFAIVRSGQVPGVRALLTSRFNKCSGNGDHYDCFSPRVAIKLLRLLDFLRRFRTFFPTTHVCGFFENFSCSEHVSWVGFRCPRTEGADKGVGGSPDLRILLR